MSRFCLFSLVLLALALGRSEGYSCALVDMCCTEPTPNCGPDPSCNCSPGCREWGNCCEDYEYYCVSCGEPFRNIQGKCIGSFGTSKYYNARKKCEQRNATLFMPRTEEDWTNFVDSAFYRMISWEQPGLRFWLNCVMSRFTWYWRVPGVPFPGVRVGWNKFGSGPTYRKATGLIGMAVGRENPWSWSKQWKDRHTFCQKIDDGSSPRLPEP